MDTGYTDNYTVKNLNSDDKFKDKIYLIKKSNLNNFYDDEINVKHNYKIGNCK